MTIEEIQKSDSIPISVKRALEGLEMQDLRPVALTEWARTVFAEGRTSECNDVEICEWIKTYAADRAYSKKQISHVLKLNGVVRQEQGHFKSRSGSESRGQIGNWLPTFKDVCLEFTGASETDIMNGQYSPKQAVKLARHNILDWVTATEEAELKANLRWINIVRELLDTMAKEIEEKLKARVKYGKIER